MQHNTTQHNIIMKNLHPQQQDPPLDHNSYDDEDKAPEEAVATGVKQENNHDHEGQEGDPVNQKIALVASIESRTGRNNNYNTVDDASDNLSNQKVSLLGQRTSLRQATSSTATPTSPPPPEMRGTTTQDDATIKESVLTYSMMDNNYNNDDGQPKPGAVSVQAPLGRSTTTTTVLREHDSTHVTLTTTDRSIPEEAETPATSHLIQAELVNEEEIAQKALERTVRAHAEPWISTQDLNINKDDDIPQESFNPRRKFRTLLRWVALAMIALVVGVTLIVVLTASNNGGDNNSMDNERIPAVDTENNNDKNTTPTVVSPPSPTLAPTTAPTQLEWQATARMDGYVVDDLYDSFGGDLVGSNGRFGWNVAITPAVYDNNNNKNNNKMVDVYITFADDQSYFGRRRLRQIRRQQLQEQKEDNKARDLLAVSSMYQMIVFTCDDTGCSNGDPIETIDDTVYQPFFNWPFAAWTLSFTQDGTAMAIVAADQIFHVYDSLSFMEDLTDYLDDTTTTTNTTTTPPSFVDAKISQDGSFVACLTSNNVAVLQQVLSPAEVVLGWITHPVSWSFPANHQMVALATSGTYVAVVGDQGDFENLLQPENLPFSGYTLQVYNVETALRIGQTIQVPQGESVLSARSLAMANNGNIMALGSSREEIPRFIGYANRQDEGRVTVWQLVNDDSTNVPTMSPVASEAPAHSDAPVWSPFVVSDVTVAPPVTSNGGGGFTVNIGDSAGYTWRRMGSILEGATKGNMFGHSVALSRDGKTLAVGAPNDSTNAVGAGLVSVYRFDGTDWRKLGGDLLGQAATSNFGWSVDVSPDGNYVVVGAPGSDTRGDDVGEAFLFSLAGI
eukprot:scaffold470_cov194-Amphora_coffeaeformis.AAC.6